MKISNFADIKNILFNNLNTKQTIFKNTFWLAGSTAINKLMSFVLMIYAARMLGAVNYGKFTFAIAFISLLTVFSDFGLSVIITRNFARGEEKKEDFYSVLSLKILLTLFSFFLIVLTSFFTIKEKEIQGIIFILSLFFLINNFIGMFYSFFQARQKMEYEAWLEILQVLLLFSFGFFALFNFPSVVNLSYSYSLSSLITVFFVLIFFHFKIFHIKIEWDKSVWKKFLSMSWPLALIGLFGVIYGYTDSVMLGYWKMMAETGWYNAASKVAMAALVPMGLIAASFYPALSKFSKESKEKFQKIWNYELEIMIILALPLVVSGLFLASKIIQSFYPSEFAPSILVFQILIFTAGIIFIYRPFYDAMIVLNQQTKIFWITIAGAIINVILNAILIPKYTLYGAAAATVISNFIILFIIILFAEKFASLKLSIFNIFSTFLISAISCILMYLVIKQPVIYKMNISLLVLIGALSYSVGFLFLKKYILNYFK